MSDVVVDASAALSWLIPSQATSASRDFIGRFAGLRLQAPFVFGWEVNNILLGFVRGGRLRPAAYEAALDLLQLYPVRLGAPFHASEVIGLARSEGLSLFDAAYLRYALNADAALASRDRALLAVAQRRGLRTHDLSPEPKA